MFFVLAARVPEMALKFAILRKHDFIRWLSLIQLFVEFLVFARVFDENFLLIALWKFFSLYPKGILVFFQKFPDKVQGRNEVLREDFQIPDFRERNCRCMQLQSNFLLIA